MAKEETETRGEKPQTVVPMPISAEIKESFMAYSMSVITSRALPDVRDGLKPVHRRILFAMHNMGLTAGAKFRKSAAVVGEVLGNYHPHGDSSVYEAMVKMAQGFSYRYPLVIGQGNFGSIDGDSAAAMRYTEAKMSKLSSELLADIAKETVDFQPNYDDTKQEPRVLPSAVPHLLVNGELGIAVGMATNIPPHNLGEVVDACVCLIDNNDATNVDLVEHIKGPDFPIGGIIFNKKDIAQAYATGRGGVVTRGETEIVETKKGNFQIVVSSIPFRVNKTSLIEKIAKLVQEKKLKGIKDFRDESTADMRIVIELKNGINPQRILNFIYKHTDLETKFNFNMVALVDGVPQTLSLKEILEHFIEHRKEVVRRRSEFDLKKAQARAHILEGLKKALDNIDEVIQTIKKSKDTPSALVNLMKKFKFTQIQAQAILDMRLQKLAGLERKKIEDELKEELELIKSLIDLLKSPKRMLAVIRDELLAIKDKYNDERRTRVMVRGVKSISDEDLVQEKAAILVYTKGGYVKRSDPEEFKKQKRGGLGVVDMNTKEEDVVTHMLTTNTKSDLLFFTDMGKVYLLKMYDIPESRRATRGKSIMNYLQLADHEHVTSILPVSKDHKETKGALIFVTRHGVVKRVNYDDFKNVRQNGLIAINLKEDDTLLSVRFVADVDDVVLITKKGQSIRFTADDVRVMGRTAAGVRGITLKKDDQVVGVGVVRQQYRNSDLLVLTENGYGKRTQTTEYKTQSRGGSGIKTANVTDKTGAVVGAQVVPGGHDHELIAISEKSQIIRIELNDVPELGRATQGVRIMKLRSGDRVVSLTLLDVSENDDPVQVNPQDAN